MAATIRERVGTFAPVDQEPCKTLFQTLNLKKFISGYLYIRHSKSHHIAMKIETVQLQPDLAQIMLAAESCGLNSVPRPAIPAKDGMWCKYWAEHVGLAIRLWRVAEDIAGLPYATAPTADAMAGMELAPHKNVISLIKLMNPNPFVVPIAHVQTSIIGIKQALPEYLIDLPPPPTPYDSFYSIATLRGATLVVAAPSSIQANSWVASIRLAIYELARLEEYFTLSIMKDPPFYRIWQDRQLTPFTNTPREGAKPIKHSGVVQAMFGKKLEWKNYYAVLSTTQVPQPLPLEDGIPEKKKKQLFKSSSGAPPMMNVGQLLFFEKKMEKSTAVKKVVQITEAYLVWPSSSAMGELSDCANVLRVEGVVIDRNNSTLAVPGTTAEEKRTSSLQMDNSPPSRSPTPEKRLRHSDSRESLATDKSLSSLNATDGKVETFYLRMADSWDACQWAASFMSAFQTDADLYERDRQLREGQVGLIDDGTSAPLVNGQPLPRQSNRDSVAESKRSSTPPTVIANNDAIDVIPSGRSSESESDHSDSPRNPASIPNWMRSHRESNSAEHKWGLLYLRASEVCNLCMAGVSLQESVKDFHLALNDKRGYHSRGEISKWNNIVKQERGQRRTSEWHEAENKAIHVINWLNLHGQAAFQDEINAADNGASWGEAPANQFLPHPVFPETVFIRAPTNDRPYGMTAADLNPSMAAAAGPSSSLLMSPIPEQTSVPPTPAPTSVYNLPTIPTFSPFQSVPTTPAVLVVPGGIEDLNIISRKLTEYAPRVHSLSAVAPRSPIEEVAQPVEDEAIALAEQPHIQMKPTETLEDFYMQDEQPVAPTDNHPIVIEEPKEEVKHLEVIAAEPKPRLSKDGKVVIPQRKSMESLPPAPILSEEVKRKSLERLAGAPILSEEAKRKSLENLPPAPVLSAEAKRKSLERLVAAAVAPVLLSDSIAPSKSIDKTNDKATTSTEAVVSRGPTPPPIPPRRSKEQLREAARASAPKPEGYKPPVPPRKSNDYLKSQISKESLSSKDVAAGIVAAATNAAGSTQPVVAPASQMVVAPPRTVTLNELKPLPTFPVLPYEGGVMKDAVVAGTVGGRFTQPPPRNQSRLSTASATLTLTTADVVNLHKAINGMATPPVRTESVGVNNQRASTQYSVAPISSIVTAAKAPSNDAVNKNNYTIMSTSPVEDHDSMTPKADGYSMDTIRASTYSNMDTIKASTRRPSVDKMSRSGTVTSLLSPIPTFPALPRLDVNNNNTNTSSNSNNSEPIVSLEGVSPVPSSEGGNDHDSDHSSTRDPMSPTSNSSSGNGTGTITRPNLAVFHEFGSEEDWHHAFSSIAQGKVVNWTGPHGETSSDNHPGSDNHNVAAAHA
ncbi:hypothetical protein SmJEL517_g03945 [Synchytrium microbalum]|uniref:Skg3/CAF120-like PH-like domain-containing protein n=1 Tax=Synchytrium microbalum TaxID=1806994 RepID=A0A507C537_9FUNG|nr:uncharacterized protein SmJEL517_g03945 [Synchytrium microbalum]TPX33096.1 hypothetical protein SmJEL517_g03945 [Synchytrium microbalum]